MKSMQMIACDEDNPQNQVVVPTTFLSYLSVSLLAITYQFLAMATAMNSAIEGICSKLNDTMAWMRGHQADRMANELQFLINTLKNYVSDECWLWPTIACSAPRLDEVEASKVMNLMALPPLKNSKDWAVSMCYALGNKNMLNDSFHLFNNKKMNF
eukprot:scaffold207976_cov61-Attheya_sp.AAC.1